MCFNFLADKLNKLGVVIIGFVGIFTVGCSPIETINAPTPTFEGELTPYLTTTPSLTPDTASALIGVPPTEIPAPTPTPFVYTVIENDTLIGIAVRHSVNLEDLIAANPGIDPNFLTIGLTLTIPLDGVVTSALPTATPVPLEIQPPICYPLADGNLQCLAVIENTQPFAVENVVALVSLQPADGSDPVVKSAIPPLNWVPAGQKTAVVAIFESPPTQKYEVRASLLSVIAIADDDQRYLQPDLQLDDAIIAEDGNQANVSGTLLWTGETTEVSAIWIAVLAYDNQEKIVGIRKWIADDSLLSEAPIDFEFTVYSLGPEIDSVEVQAEVRP